MQVLGVHGEAPREAGSGPRAEAGAPLQVLTHHQHGVVQHALGALRHGVHPDHEDDVDYALRTESWGGQRGVVR